MFAQQDLVSWTSAVITVVLAAPIAAVVGVVASGGEPDRTMSLWGIMIGAGVVAVCAFLVAGAFKGHWAAVHVRDDSTP